MIGLVTSPELRRELAPYLRYLFARGAVGAGLRPLSRAWTLRWDRRRPPDGLCAPAGDLDLPSPEAPRAHLPIAVPTGGDGLLGDIQLATRAWSLADGPPWTARFEDPEDGLAAHRFAWILPALVTHGAAALGALAELAVMWLDAHPPEDGAPGWDSYSVAERVVHFSCLASALEARPGRGGERLVAALPGHAVFLRRRLELRGASTNNHLINDARALYVAGAILGCSQLRAEAREIVAYGARRMFVSGFLREGSSHYHLLLARTFLELWLVARACGDARFAADLEVWARPIVAAAAFFDGHAGFPLIGDVSPDFTPAFLRDVAAAGRALLDGATRPSVDGWAALFSPLARGETRASAGPAVPPALCAFAEAGYYRLASGPWRVWAWVNPLGYVPAWSHAHADIGSFVVEWNGAPLLVDAGRSTYRAVPIGVYGRSIRSHNAISIDGHEPCVAHGLNGYPELMAGDYAHRPPSASAREDAGAVTLRIEHDGFARLGDGLMLRRSVSARSRDLVVDDAVTGAGRHVVETFFHFHPDVEITEESETTWQCAPRGLAPLVLRGPRSARAVHLCAVDGPRPAGWYSPAYGRLLRASTLIFTYDGPLPVEQRYVFEAA